MVTVALRFALLGSRCAGPKTRLRVFDQFFNPSRIVLAMPMALDRIRASGGFNQDFRPYHAGLNVDGSDFGDAHAHFVHFEKRPLAASHGFFAHLDISGEKKISFRPAAGFKNFGRHKLRMQRSSSLANHQTSQAASGNKTGNRRALMLC